MPRPQVSIMQEMCGIKGGSHCLTMNCLLTVYCPCSRFTITFTVQTNILITTRGLSCFSNYLLCWYKHSNLPFSVFWLKENRNRQVLWLSSHYLMIGLAFLSVVIQGKGIGNDGRSVGGGRERRSKQVCPWLGIRCQSASNTHHYQLTKMCLSCP